MAKQSARYLGWFSEAILHGQSYNKVSKTYINLVRWKKLSQVLQTLYRSCLSKNLSQVLKTWYWSCPIKKKANDLPFLKQMPQLLHYLLICEHRWLCQLETCNSSDPSSQSVWIDFQQLLGIHPLQRIFLNHLIK